MCIRDRQTSPTCLWNTGEVYTVELYARVRRAVIVDKISAAILFSKSARPSRWNREFKDLTLRLLSSVCTLCNNPQFHVDSTPRMRISTVPGDRDRLSTRCREGSCFEYSVGKRGCRKTNHIHLDVGNS